MFGLGLLLRVCFGLLEDMVCLEGPCLRFSHKKPLHLEGQRDLVSRLITTIRHTIATPTIPIIAVAACAMQMTGFLRSGVKVFHMSRSMVDLELLQLPTFLLERRLRSKDGTTLLSSTMAAAAKKAGFQLQILEMICQPGRAT